MPWSKPRSGGPGGASAAGPEDLGGRWVAARRAAAEATSPTSKRILRRSQDRLRNMVPGGGGLGGKGIALILVAVVAGVGLLTGLSTHPSVPPKSASNLHLRPLRRPDGLRA